MLRAMGYEQDVLRVEKGIIFAVRAVNIEYLMPARFNELLQVSSEVSLIKPASLEFEQSIYRDDDTLSKAVVRIACLDSMTMRPKKIPENLIVELR